MVGAACGLLILCGCGWALVLLNGISAKLCAGITLPCLLAAMGLLLWRYVRHKRAIAQLHTQIMDYLERRADLPFSVQDDLLAIVQNDAAELAYRIDTQRQMTEQERQKNAQFVADISHQLKTPLAALRLNCETQLYRRQNAEMQRQLLLVERMEQLVYSLLRLEKLQADAYQMQFEPQPLLPMIEQIWQELHSLYPEKQLHLQDCGLELRCDRQWLREALHNILKNACEHTQPSGNVYVQAQREETQITLLLWDDGGGIPESELPQLFRRYFRASSSVSGNGVGLGLAIAKAIIRKHHGSICTLSGKPGLCIQICLPIVEARLSL